MYVDRLKDGQWVGWRNARGVALTGTVPMWKSHPIKNT